MHFVIGLMNRLAYPKKIFLIFVVFLIPMIMLISLLSSQLGMGISVAEKEVRGLEYIKTVRQLYQHLPQHRGMTNAYLNGASGYKSKIINQRVVILADIAAIDSSNNQYGDEFKTHALWSEIKQTWQQLEPRTFNQPAKIIFQQHTALIALTYNLFEQISNESGLILDPTLNTFFIMDAIVYRLPNITENLGQARGLASGISASGVISLEQSIRLGSLLANIKSNKRAVDKGMLIALRENPSMASELTPLLNASKLATTNFIKKVSNELLLTETINSQSSDIFDAGSAAIKANYKIYDTLLPILDNLFEDRIAGFSRQHTIIYTAVLITLLIVIYLFIGFYKSMITAVEKLRDAVQKVSTGDLTAIVDCGTEDELKDIEVSLNSMIQHLNKVVKYLDSNAALLASTSEELSTTTSQASASSRKQKLQTDQVAVAMNEMTSAVLEIAHHADLVASESQTGTVMGVDSKRAQKITESTSGEPLSLKVIDLVTKTSDLSFLVASASEQQSLVSEEINRNIVDIADLSVENMNDSDKISLGSDELAKLASELRMIVSYFKV